MRHLLQIGNIIYNLLYKYIIYYLNVLCLSIGRNRLQDHHNPVGWAESETGALVSGSTNMLFMVLC